MEKKDVAPKVIPTIELDDDDDVVVVTSKAPSKPVAPALEIVIPEEQQRFNK